MRIARTIADLSGDDTVNRSHILRAAALRRAL